MSGSSNVDAFAKAARVRIKPKKPKPPPPFSIRFTWPERERLEQEAGKLSLTAYIRFKLFGDNAPTKRKPTRRQKQVPVDYVLLGQILGLLGESELARSLCLLAVAAESGSLPVSDEVENEIKAACARVDDIRLILIKALGVKSQ